MYEGLTNELLLEAIVIAALAALVAMRDLPAMAAMTIALVRVGISVIYFAWYYDGTWNVIDDLVYFSNGASLLSQDFNPISALLTFEGFEHLQVISGGHHVLYSWWNLLAQYLFGEYYFAPVFLNVLITFLTAALIHRTAALMGFASGYCLGLQCFYLLHWDVIAWSSLMNIKDPLVQFLTVAALYCAVRFLSRRDWTSVLGFVALIQIFYWIRFYLPFLILLTVACWIVWQWNDWRKFIIIALTVIGGYLSLPVLQQHSDSWNLSRILDGSIRFTLTPLPWSILDGYSFLTIPAILHSLFLIPALTAAYALWRKVPMARLYLIYLGVIVFLYAITQDLQGPRQRFQVAFIFAWIQFHFLWSLNSNRQTFLRPIAKPVSRPRNAHAPWVDTPGPVGVGVMTG